jgi:hypothetical protein
MSKYKNKELSENGKSIDFKKSLEENFDERLKR